MPPQKKGSLGDSGDDSTGSTRLTNDAIAARLRSLGKLVSAANIAKVRRGELNLDDLEAAKTLIRVPEIEAAETLISMPEIKAAWELIEFRSRVVQGDLDLAITELGSGKGGKIGRRMKGGSDTGDALIALRAQLFAANTTLAGNLDKLGATIVNSIIPGLKGVGGILFLKTLGSNPWLFSQLAAIVRNNWVYFVPTAEDASYTHWREHLKDTLITLGKLIGPDQLNYVTESPMYAFIISAAIVHHLANKNRKSPLEYLEEKTKYALSVVGMVYTGGKEIVKGFIAYMKTPEAQKSFALQSLRNQIKDLKRTDGVIYEGLGPAEIEGLMKQTPSPAETTALAAQRLVEVLQNIPPPTASPDDPMGQRGGRRRRKTKKRAIKKRKMTRRALTFSY